MSEHWRITTDTFPFNLSLFTSYLVTPFTQHFLSFSHYSISTYISMKYKSR